MSEIVDQKSWVEWLSKLNSAEKLSVFNYSLVARERVIDYSGGGDKLDDLLKVMSVEIEHEISHNGLRQRGVSLLGTPLSISRGKKIPYFFLCELIDDFPWGETRSPDFWEYVWDTFNDCETIDETLYECAVEQLGHTIPDGGKGEAWTKGLFNVRKDGLGVKVDVV